MSAAIGIGRYRHCPNLTIIDTPGFILKVGQSQTQRLQPHRQQHIQSLMHSTAHINFHLPLLTIACPATAPSG
jgi:hypothetical protein